MYDLVGNPEDRFSYDAAHSRSAPWLNQGNGMCVWQRVDQAGYLIVSP